MIVDFKFDIEQRVKIKELELTGTVISLWYGRRGKEYEVRYCSNSEYKQIYFYEQDLDAKE